MDERDKKGRLVVEGWHLDIERACFNDDRYLKNVCIHGTKYGRNGGWFCQDMEEIKHWTPEWIPCAAELPEPGEMVLVTTQTKKGRRDVNRAYYMDGSWHGAGSMAGVVAWMPMPEPWKGET